MLTITASSTRDAIKNSQTWRDAVADLIDFYTANDKCFSSGEIAAEIRIHRTDLQFSVLNLGEYVRDLYYNGAIAYQNAPAYQIARTTQGLGRTPAGKHVFVYGPDPVAVATHPFEVDIPQPGQGTGTRLAPFFKKSGYPTAIAPAPSSAPAPVQPVVFQPSSALTATVHTDRRLCVTRRVMDQYLAAMGRAIRPGEQLFVKIEEDQAVVSLDPLDGAKTYELIQGGRILFPRPDKPLSPGDRYEVRVTATTLTINLSSPQD